MIGLEIKKTTIWYQQKTAEISDLSSSKIDNYEYLTGK